MVMPAAMLVSASTTLAPSTACRKRFTGVAEVPSAGSAVTFGTTTAGLSGFSTSGTGSANKQTLTLPAVAKTPTGLIYQNVSLGAYAYNPIKTQFVTNNNGFIQFFGGFANTVLRPNSGIVVVLAAPTGGLTAAVSFDWVEYGVT